MRAAAQARIDTIVTALGTLPAADRRAIVAADPALRTLAARVTGTAGTG